MSAVDATDLPRVLLVGAGGHARMCIEALNSGASVALVGAVSADGTGLESLGVPVLGCDVDVEKIAQRENVSTFCVAIGHNSTRERHIRMLTERGHLVTRVVSPSAIVSTTAVLGAGVQLMPAAVVNAATSLGVGTIVNTNATVDHDCRVGDFVHIGPGVAIGGDVTIGDRALIGLGARVLPGITIGADATVGAGAVVIADVRAGATVVGVPARELSPQAQAPGDQ